MLMSCSHCGLEFSSNNLNRKYCCNSCNVLASYARNGRPGERAAKLAEAKKKVSIAAAAKRATGLAEAREKAKVIATAIKADRGARR